MTPRQKLIYFGAVPIMAASIGGAATYFATPEPRERIIVTGEAAKAARDGKLVIEVVTRDETDKGWMMIFAAPFMFLGLAAMYWAASKN